MHLDSTGLDARDPVPAEPRGITRRGALQGGAGSALAVGLAASFARKAWASPAPPVLSRSPLLVLHNRATCGFNGEEWANLSSGGATTESYRDYLLNVSETSPDTRADTWVDPYLKWTDATVEQVFFGLNQLETIHLLRHCQIARSVYSRNQLHERVYDFWTDHFNTFLDQDGAAAGGPTVVREVTRRFGLTERDAAGNFLGDPSTFPKLLKASAQSAAMLWYLDNWKSRAGTGINENYGRELLELHTLGTVDPTIPGSPPNYTQSDVVAAANILTGWRFFIAGDPGLIPPPNGNFGVYNFFPADHIPGPHTLLGQPFHVASSPEQEGLDLLAFLSDPSFPGGRADVTGKYLAYKLLRFFIEYDPTSADAEIVKTVYMDSGGNLKKVVEEVLSDDNLNRVSTQNKLKLRRPSQLAYALLRAVDRPGWDNPPSSPWQPFDQWWYQDGLHSELLRMGNLPYGWASPDGYPDSVEAWSDGLFARWSLCHRFFARPNGGPGIPGVEIDDAMLARLLTDNASSSLTSVALGSLGQTIDNLLTGGVMAAADVAAVQELVNELTNNPGPYTGITLSDRIRLACSLGAASPSFQYY